MTEIIPDFIKQEKRVGVKKGTKRGAYKKRDKNNNQPPVNTENNIQNNTQTNTSNFGKAQTQKEVLDEIEDLGRENFNKFLEKQPPAENEVKPENTETIKEEVKEEEKKEESTSTLNKEFVEDNENYEEIPDSVKVEVVGDANNEMFSGSIMFVIWDLFMPAISIKLYSIAASTKTREKLQRINRENLGLTDDQKIEMEKMGLASGMAKILFEKMPKWVAFIVIGVFFTTMNVKIELANTPD